MEDKMYNELLELGVSEEALVIVTDVAGYSVETLRNVMYSVYGTHCFSWEVEE